MTLYIYIYIYSVYLLIELSMRIQLESVLHCVESRSLISVFKCCHSFRVDLSLCLSFALTHCLANFIPLFLYSSTPLNFCTSLLLCVSLSVSLLQVSLNVISRLSPLRSCTRTAIGPKLTQH